MTSTTDPTVALPTATNTEDDDDDDDDVSSSLLSGQPPAASTTPQPTVAPAPTTSPTDETLVPGTLSVEPTPTTSLSPVPPNASVAERPSVSTSVRPSSATEFADRLPTGSSTALSPTDSGNDNTGGSRGLGTGASVGIGIGVVVVVCLAAFGMWYFLRRRKTRRTKTRSTSSPKSNEEQVQRPSKPDVYAYRVGEPAEVSGDVKARRWSELESPAYVAEVGSGQVFRAELPGSDVPTASAKKECGGRLFADAPIDETDEPGDAQRGMVDTKRDDRLFSDPPIDEGNDILVAEQLSRPMETKD